MSENPTILHKLKIEITSGSRIIDIGDIIYLSDVSGVLKSSVVDSVMKSAITVVYSKKNIKLINNNNGLKYDSRSKLIIFNNGFDIILDEECQVIIVNQEFYSLLGIPSFEYGIIEHIHESIINALFESIINSGKPEYEIVALANLIGVDFYHVKSNVNYKKIVDCVSINYVDNRFNLDELCFHTHMSRRKAQYILSDNNTSFLELVNSFRVVKLKDLLKREPDSNLGLLASKAGFKNLNSANKYFHKQTNYKIRDYRNMLAGRRI